MKISIQEQKADKVKSHNLGYERLSDPRMSPLRMSCIYHPFRRKKLGDNLVHGETINKEMKCIKESIMEHARPHLFTNKK